MLELDIVQRLIFVIGHKNNMIHLNLPIHWKIWKKTEFLWMNMYRNAHFRTLSKLKIDYTNSLSELKWKLLKTPISITYVFHPSRSDQDMDNCISVAGKFLQDSLVHYWVIEWDTYKHIPLTKNIAGEKDKEWFIEVCIEEI